MKKCLIILLMVSLSSLLALFAGELMLRHIVHFPQPQFLLPDSHLGHRHRANLAGYYAREGFAYVRINSAGLRDKEYSREKTAKKRFAVLGDSYTEAFQVDIKDSYHELLETHFSAELEVLNFGVSGYGTCQELLMYRQLVRQFDPDVVVLAFYPQNDLEDNDRELSDGYSRPYCRFGTEGLEIDYSFRNTAKHTRPEWIYRLYYFLTDNFIIFSLLDQLRYRQGNINTGLVHGNQAVLEKQSDLLFAPTSVQHLNAWLVSERLVLQLAEEVTQDGAQFVLLVQDSLPAQLAKGDQAFYVEQRLGEFCHRYGLLCAFMGPSAVAIVEAGGNPLHGFAAGEAGHWNSAGHQLAYRVLRDTLIANGVISD